MDIVDKKKKKRKKAIEQEITLKLKPMDIIIIDDFKKSVNFNTRMLLQFNLLLYNTIFIN